MDELGMQELMESEGLEPEDVREIGQIETIEQILPMEITDQVPGFDRAVVCGDPINLGDKLDFQQGFDNPYGAFGTCGLTSIANLCYIGGKEVSEPEVVEYAMENGLCEEVEPGVWGGGTSISDQIKILDHYGFSAHCEFPDVASGERLAEAVEGGHGVLLGVNSGILQDRDWKVYDKDGNIGCTHTVCLTGTVRSAETGDLVGFYLCDSSAQTPDGGRTFVPMDKFDQCYEEVQGAYAVITDEPIR